MSSLRTDRDSASFLCLSASLGPSRVPHTHCQCLVTFCWVNERMSHQPCHSKIMEMMRPRVSELALNPRRFSLVYYLPLTLPRLLLFFILMPFPKTLVLASSLLQFDHSKPPPPTPNYPFSFSSGKLVGSSCEKKYRLPTCKGLGLNLSTFIICSVAFLTF